MKWILPKQKKQEKIRNFKRMNWIVFASMRILICQLWSVEHKLNCCKNIQMFFSAQTFYNAMAHRSQFEHYNHLQRCSVVFRRNAEMIFVFCGVCRHTWFTVSTNGKTNRCNLTGKTTNCRRCHRSLFENGLAFSCCRVCHILTSVDKCVRVKIRKKEAKIPLHVLRHLSHVMRFRFWQVQNKNPKSQDAIALSSGITNELSVYVSAQCQMANGICRTNLHLRWKSHVRAK